MPANHKPMSDRAAPPQAAALPLLMLLLLVVPLPAHAQTAAYELPDPARFEQAIQRFEAMDQESPPPENAILLTGSSSIMFWNEQAPEDLAPLTVIPRGFGGSVLNDVLYFMDRVVLRYQPRAVLIYEGDNDTFRNIPNAVIIDQLHEAITRIHAELPEARIYVLSVKPSIAREDIWPVATALNEKYRQLAAARPLLHYIDVATPFLRPDGSIRDDIFVDDMLHLNDTGYELWAASIREVLMAHEAHHEPAGTESR